MANYRVTCVRQEPVNEPDAQFHIVAVGTGHQTGLYSVIWAVDEVLNAIRQGHLFFTQGDTSGKVAGVREVICPHCHRIILRSTADAVPDNNLDSLPRCG